MSLTADADPAVLDALYRGATEEASLDQALTLIRNRFSCRGAALVSLDAHAPGANLILTAGVFKDEARRYQEFAALDPAPAAFARLPVGGASTTNRIIPAEQRAKSTFLHEYFLPLGVTETLGANLYCDQARFALIGLQRGDDRPEFSDREIAALERLAPHVARALQLRRAFARLEARIVGLQYALDRLHAGLLLLDGKGVALFANAAMRRLAERGDGFALDRMGRPLPAELEARRRVEALLRAVMEGGAGGIVTVSRQGGARPYAVLVSPAPTTLAEFSLERKGRVRVLILVHDPESRTAGAPEILEKSLGLTRGAAKLVAALAGDDDLKSFAEREGVTIHTARFHLRTALTRTGARTQSDLVRLAVRLLRDFGLRANGAG